MYKKIILPLACLLLVGLFVIGSTLPASVARADHVLQSVPLLSGVKIYFTEANGESSRFDRSNRGISRLAGLLYELGATMDTLDWRTSIPADADLVIIAGPQTDIAADQTARLWSYLEKDASVLLLAGALTGPARRPIGVPGGSGLFDLAWSDIGVRARDDTVVTEQIIGDSLTLVDKFTATNFAPGNPITDGLTGVTFFHARSMEIDTTGTQFRVTPLVFAPGNYYGETAFVDYLTTGVARYNIGEDTARGQLALGVLAENAAANTRIAIIGDHDLITNGVGMATSPAGSDGLLYPDNARFITRLIGWLVKANPELTYEFAFSTPGPTATPTLTPTPVITTADIGVSMSSNTTDPREGDALVYTVNVTNVGPDEALGVTVSIVLPLDVTFITATSPSRREYNPVNGIWTVGTMQTGETLSLTIIVTVNQGSAGRTISNTARAAATSSIDSQAANDVATIEVTVRAAGG